MTYNVFGGTLNLAQFNSIQVGISLSGSKTKQLSCKLLLE